MKGSYLRNNSSEQVPEGEPLFDPVRRKKVQATPEERIRQEFIRYLYEEKGHPYGLMEVEKGFQLHKRFKRCDILTRDNELNPFMIVECKAPAVPIDQGVFDQVARYNIAFKVPYLVVTNGQDHYACQVRLAEQKLRFLSDIPEFRER